MFYDLSVSKLTEEGKTVSMAGIAIPKLMEQIFAHLLSTVHTLMLSGYSTDAVAATNVSGQIYSFANLFVGLISVGMGVIISVSIGEGNTKRTKAATGTCLWTGTVFSVCFVLLICVFSSPVISLMNLKGRVREIAVEYLCLSSLALPFSCLLSCFNMMLICRGYAKLTFLSGVVTNVLNVCLGYVVLYSGLNLPVTGANGLAVGALISSIVGMVVSLFFCIKKECLKGAFFQKRLVGDVFRIGFPGTMNSTSYNIAQIISTGFIATFGVAAINTKVFVASLATYTYQISLALAQGNRVLAGRYRGMKEFDKMKKLHRQNLMLSIMCNMSVSLLIYIFREPLLSLFTTDPDIIKAAGILLLVDVFVEFPRAANHIFESSHIANGDAGATFWISFISCWAVSVLFGYILGIKAGFGLVGIWIAYAFEEGFKTVAYIFRWKSEKWRYTHI